MKDIYSFLSFVNGVWTLLWSYSHEFECSESHRLGTDTSGVTVGMRSPMSHTQSNLETGQTDRAQALLYNTDCGINTSGAYRLGYWHAQVTKARCGHSWVHISWGRDLLQSHSLGCWHFGGLQTGVWTLVFIKTMLWRLLGSHTVRYAWWECPYSSLWLH